MRIKEIARPGNLYTIEILSGNRQKSSESWVRDFVSRILCFPTDLCYNRRMSKPVATNKKAYHNFFLSDKWECGIVLTGGEVKSVRTGLVSFKDSYATLDKDEVYLHKLHITPYKEASYLNDEPDRRRKLLLHNREIKKISGLIKERGVTLVPTKLYFTRRGLLKVELAVGRGKKLYDKRQDIKNRAIEKGLKRAIKNRN